MIPANKPLKEHYFLYGLPKHRKWKTTYFKEDVLAKVKELRRSMKKLVIAAIYDLGSRYSEKGLVKEIERRFDSVFGGSEKEKGGADCKEHIISDLQRVTSIPSPSQEPQNNSDEVQK